MTEPELIRLVLDRIVGTFAPLRVVLFGSRARGEGRPDSDLDLLVVLPEAPNPRQAAVNIRRALRDLPVSKDIVVSTPEALALNASRPGTIWPAILREGKVLFERL